MLALVFPGQGAQVVGMGRELAERYPEARATLAEADEALSFPLSRLCFEGPEEELRRTENTQPAIVAVSIAALRVLRARTDLTIGVAAGHSLGEYSAHVSAGTMTFGEALRAVRARGGFMQAAVREGVGAMAAILGIPSEVVEEACVEASDSQVVAPANLNGEDQTVISGHVAAVERAAAICKSKGARRVVPLSVSAPFHCALMQPAADRMRPVLDQIDFKAPSFPIVSNVEALACEDAARLRELLVLQVTAAVRWHESMLKMREMGADTFVELGPGRVLSGLLRRVARDARLLNVEDADSLENTVKELP